ncbi:MAG: hypothetical protein WC657_07965 [Candidatus Paceibacterota bacterium]|jgi:hypothetical protein
MTRVNNQLLKLMSILDEQARLNPKGAEIQLRVGLFVDCPDHDPLLNKLETEHKVITILQRPDERGFGDPDHGMFEMEQPKNYERYMSYFVTLKPTFDEFYKTEYLKQRSTTSTLTDNNRALVIEVMRAIDDEVSISGKTQVNIDPVQSEDLCKKALVFLKKVGAIKDYEAIDEIDFNGEYERMMPTGQIDVFKVEVILPNFDEVLAEIENDKPAEPVVTEPPEPSDDADDKVAATPEQERTVLFMAIIGKAFGNSKQENISVPFATFKPLTFKQVNALVDQYAGSKTFIVKNRPKTPSDKVSYEFELTEHQKTAFDELKNNFAYLRDLQMLMIYWGKMCELYDAISGGYVGFEDGLLNRHYLLLTIRIDKILAKDEFAEFDEKPFIYDSFMGNMEDLDMAYEFMRPELWGYYGKLERLWVEKADGLGAFKLEDEEQKLLDDTDKAIAGHRKEKARLNANFEKRLETAAEKYNAEQKPTGKSEVKIGKGKVIIDKQSKPKIEYPDDTVPERYEEPANEPTVTAPVTVKVDIHPLQPNHYHDKTGKLAVSGTVNVSIAVRGKVARKNRIKYDQCHLMSCLFKSVNTLKNGVTFSTFLGVKYDKNNKKHIRKIRNTVDEINKKVAGKTTAKRLIFIQAEKIFLNSSYL